MHLAMQVGPQGHLNLPPLDDHNAIQLAIMKAAQCVVDGSLPQKQAGLLGYYLQLASNNVGRVKFEPEPENPESEDGEDGNDG